MGGRGSGPKATFGFLTDTTAEFDALDIVRLARCIEVHPGACGVHRWLRDGRPAGAFGYDVEHHGLRLSYRVADVDGYLHDVVEHVSLTATATRFGGERLWCRCPACQRRCRTLYRAGRLRCRTCLGLRYESQYEPGYARAARRALKLRDRLGEATGIDDPLPARPKGMHRRTYQHLAGEIERLSMVWWRAAG